MDEDRKRRMWYYFTEGILTAIPLAWMIMGCLIADGSMEVPAVETYQLAGGVVAAVGLGLFVMTGRLIDKTRTDEKLYRLEERMNELEDQYCKEFRQDEQKDE